MPAKKQSKKVKNNDKKPKNNNKKKHKVRNWREYNEMLVNRGRLDVWIEESVLEDWYAKPTGKQGAQPKYSDLSIQLVLQFGKVFHQKLRQTEGLVRSIFNLMNIDLDVPDHTTIGRRGGSIEVKLPKDTKENITVIVDSSGLKVYGEGEWKVRKHGYSKRRTWRKFHLGIDPQDGEIRAVEVTENNVSDSEVAPALLDQEEVDIEAFAGDVKRARMARTDKLLSLGIVMHVTAGVRADHAQGVKLGGTGSAEIDGADLRTRPTSPSVLPRRANGKSFRDAVVGHGAERSHASPTHPLPTPTEYRFEEHSQTGPQRDQHR